MSKCADDPFAYPVNPEAGEQELPHVKYFEYLRNSQFCAADRDYIRSAHKKFHELDLPDLNLGKRFVENFAARIFEVWIAYVLDSWKWPLSAARLRGRGPDFSADLGQRKFWIEATAPGPGEEFLRGKPNRNYVQPLRSGQGYSGFFNHVERCLRYTGALQEKIKQYRRALESGLVDASDGYLVAINGARFHNRGSWDGPAPMLPEAVVPFVQEFGRPGEEIYSGATILANAPEVSAVIIEPNDIKNRPEVHGREAGFSLLVILNPSARVPFPYEKLESGRVYSGKTLIRNFQLKR